MGYLDGVISVYRIKNEAVHFTGSFRMHNDSIHAIYIIEELNFAVSSGFDSVMKVWKPPEEWEKKVVVTHSMIEGIDPKDNLSTIKEERESYDPESYVLKHKITAWGNGKGDKVVESLLQQI